MNETQIEIARKLISNKNWVWPNLMPIESIEFGGEYIALNSASGPWTDGGERVELYAYEFASGDSSWRNASEFLPDLENDATGGILLSVLRATEQLVILSPIVSGEGGWTIELESDDEYYWLSDDRCGSTLAEVCAKALISIWEGGI